MSGGTINDVLRDMKDGVFDYTSDGQCSGCGQCCTDLLPVSHKEIKEIQRYIKKHKIEPQKRFLPTADGMMFDLMCPFRNDSDRKCMIYKVRPLICRDFKCDHPKKGIKPDEQLYKMSRKVISMRTVFYG